MIHTMRGYKLQEGDIFSVDLGTFISTSTLWRSQFQILGFDSHKRNWWKIWKPRYTHFVRIQYLG